MGRAKEWLMEQQERGYQNIPNKYVCPSCVGDDALQAVIRREAVSKSCSYCGKKARSVIAAEFDTLAEAILSGLQSEYGDPNDEGVPWDGGWVGDVIDTYDALFEDVELDIESDELRQDILQSIGDHQWCQKDFYRLSPSDALQFGWRRFAKFIKHTARYVFLNIDDSSLNEWDGDHIPVGGFLEVFGRVIKNLRMVRHVPTDTTIYRIRIHDPTTSFSTAAELGAPPLTACIFPNRMSPAGIPMFYGAFDKNTCIIETYNPDGRNHFCTFGHFKNLRELVLLDLTNAPSIPSIFESGNRTRRHNITFLRSFIRDITGPITRDGTEGIDYVPTQVVSEYVRHVLTMKGERLDGIVYKSSKEGGKEACVLFFDGSACVDTTTGGSNEELLLYKVTRKRLRKA